MNVNSHATVSGIVCVGVCVRLSLQNGNLSLLSLGTIAGASVSLAYSRDVVGSVVDCVSSGNVGGAVQTTASGAVRTASTAINDSPPGQVLAAASQWSGVSLGGCISGDALGIVDMGSACYYATPSGHNGIALTAGGGGAPWGFTATAGPSISNAQTLSDFNGWFAYGQGTVALGPAVSGQGEIGQNSCGHIIGVGTLGVGGHVPLAVSGAIGANYTWTFGSW